MPKKEEWGGGTPEFEIKYITKDEAKQEYNKTNYNRESGGIVIIDKSAKKKYFFEKKRQYYAQQFYFLQTGITCTPDAPPKFTIKYKTIPELALQEFRRELIKECTEVIEFWNQENEL